MAKKYTLLHLIALGIALGTVLGVLDAQTMTDVRVGIHGAEAATVRPIQRRRTATPLERQANRLNARIERRFGITFDQAALISALEERKRVMNQVLTTTFVPDATGTAEEHKLQPWFVRLQNHADWITFVPEAEQPRFVVSATAMATALAATPPAESYPPLHTGVVEPESDGKVIRVKTGGFAHAGFSLEPVEAARILDEAIRGGQAAAVIPVQHTMPRAYVLSGSTVQELTLLASGRSDFTGSPSGREKNIVKALQEEVTDILVPAQTPFSFNDAISGSLATEDWYMALAIFAGGELEYVPGGGICQAATTVYRAALLAGLPILKRSNHSLYVTYYKKYGVGMDATVYPGKQDLVFQNDTQGPLLVQATIEGTEAIVNLYGIADGRHVAMTGPYFSSTAPEDLPMKNDRKLAKNEIAWMRTVTRSDGTASDELLLSRYIALPKSLPKEIPHAAAYSFE